MTNFACDRNRGFGKTGSQLLLCGLWTLGLISGVYLYLCYEPVSPLLMRSLAYQSVSIVGLCTCILLPLLFTFVSVCLNKTIIVMIVCFLKSAAFGYSGTCLLDAFGDAGWLLRFLVLFSDISFSCVLLLLWLCCFGAERSRNFMRVGMSLTAGLLIAVIDYFVISPFVMGL